MQVFVAGPVDFHDVDDLIEYRLRATELLEEAGCEPVDQYSDALELVRTLDSPDVAELVSNLDSLPDEPYVELVQHAMAETSIPAVIDDPALVPEHATPDLVAAVVERDFELAESTDGVLAYLPTPSCGTMAEIIRAKRAGIPVVVVSDQPPLFVQYYADAVRPDFESGIETLTTKISED